MKKILRPILVLGQGTSLLGLVSHIDSGDAGAFESALVKDGVDVRQTVHAHSWTLRPIPAWKNMNKSNILKPS